VKYFFAFISFVLLFLLAFPIFKLIYSTDLVILWETVKDGEVLKSILVSFECSFYATILGFSLGIPISYILARYNFYGKTLILAMINVPVIIPHSAAGIALLSMFAQGTFFGQTLSHFGLSIMDNKLGITLGMFFVSVPFLINHTINGFLSFDPKIEKTSRSLGANFSQTFFKISLPLARDGIVRGFIMMWSRGISEFGAVVILAYYPITSSVLIYERFTAYGLKYSRPIASILIILCILIFMLIYLLTNAKNKKHI